MRLIWIALSVAVFAGCSGGNSEQVAEISNDWTGNEVIIEALSDPKVDGVTCHMAHFDRSFIDRVSKGNWFENPSNGSISCRQTGPIVIGDIDFDKNGEEVFRQRQSLIFKKLAVRRIYDRKNDSLIYLVYSRKIVDGSAKISISTITLYDEDVTWRVDNTSYDALDFTPDLTGESWGDED